MNLYDDLKSKVDAAGVTMASVCARAGVSTGTPTHWAAGRVSPNQKTYDRLMAALREIVRERAERIKSSGLV